MIRVARLKQLATGGAASVATSVAATNILRIVSSMTLTRLLDAQSFGIVGLITSVSIVLAMLSDVGLYDFIVQHKDGDERHFRDQLWTIRLLRGIGLTLLMMALAHPLALLLDKPQIGPVIAVWSLSFTIDGLSSLAWATAVRNQQFWRLSMLDLAAGIVTIVVSVIVALMIRSYWAMIAGMIAAAMVKAILSYALFPEARRGWHFNYARSRELWGFSRYIAMSSVLSLMLMQADKLVLGRMMPLAAYGLYAIATTLAAAPTGLAVPYSTRILLSAYAHAARQGHDELRRIYYAKRRKFAMLYLVAIGGLAGSAPLVVAILYDRRYTGVAIFLQLLLISAGLKISTLAAKWALIALGNTRSSLFANICAASWLLVGGAVCLWLGNILLLVAVVGTSELPALAYYWLCLRREHILKVRSELTELGCGIVGFALGWAVATATLRLFPHI